MDPRKKSYETGSIKYAPCLKYLSNIVKYMQIFHLNILIKKKKKKLHEIRSIKYVAMVRNKY